MLRSMTLLALASLAVSSASLRAETVNTLGSASSFAVLGASTVTNIGATVLSGNLGVSPGTAIVGFPPGIVTNGATHDNDGVAILALADALTAFNSLAALTTTQNLTGQDLGGLTLTSGVYFFSSSAQLTGNLTLDFQGISNAQIVFQIGSALTTASGAQVNILNAGLNDSIYWQVGSSATLGTTTQFRGTIVAGQSIALNTGATIDCGSAIALVGAVTLDDNTINACTDLTQPPTDGPIDGPTNPSPGDTPTTAPVPEPGTFAMFATGIAGLTHAARRRLAA